LNWIEEEDNELKRRRSRIDEKKKIRLKATTNHVGVEINWEENR